MYRLLDRVMFTRGLKPGLCLFKLPVVCGTFPRPCASWLDAMDVRHSSQRERVPSISHVPVFNTKNVYDLLVSSLSNCGDSDYVRRHKINDDVIHNQRSILLEKRQQHHLLQRNSASQCVRGSRCLSTSCHRHALPPTLPAAAGVSSAVPSQLLFPDVPTIQVAEFVISSAYHITGLPWWSTIVLTAFVVRILLMMPLTIYTHHNMARLQRLAPEVKEVAERLRLEVSVAMQKLGWDQQKARQEYNKNMNRLLRELHIRDNCHPMKNTASFWLQIPLWISVSYALRNMSVKAVNPELENHSDFAGLAEQGIAWFPDLTQVDSTMILPLMMGAVTLFNIEMNYLSVPEVTKYRRYLTYVLRSVALVFVPVSAYLPSTMVLYWVSSGMFAAVQNILLDYSPFRRLVRLPQTPFESGAPFRNLWSKAKARYKNS